MSFNLSSIHLDTTIVDSTLGITIMKGVVTQGEMHPALIPTDRISSLNWNTAGSVALYARDMTLIKDYGVAERMIITDADKLSLGRCLLVGTSETPAEYYCLSHGCDGMNGRYYDGEVIQLSANEERTISGCNGHFLFCSLGTANSLEKDKILVIDSDSYVVTAGAEGAIITVFHDSTDD